MRLSGYQERDEEKRREFKQKISKIRPEDRVYIDESGMDNREDYWAACEASKRRKNECEAFQSRKARRWRICAVLGRVRPAMEPERQKILRLKIGKKKFKSKYSEVLYVRVN